MRGGPITRMGRSRNFWTVHHEIIDVAMFRNMGGHFQECRPTNGEWGPGKGPEPKAQSAEDQSVKLRRKTVSAVPDPKQNGSRGATLDFLKLCVNLNFGAFKRKQKKHISWYNK
jgi:hypothetical protein